jgi:hypothetical protein
MTDESEIKVSNKFQYSDMIKSLDALIDETVQICEYNSEEDNAKEEICDTVQLMLKQLKTSVKISPSIIAGNNNVKHAVLDQDGKVMITYNDDEVEYKKLSDFRSALLMEILSDVFPKLKTSIAHYRKTIEERLTVYRSANKKMKKIDHVLKQGHKPETEKIEEEEGLEPDLAKLR